MQELINYSLHCLGGLVLFVTFCFSFGSVRAGFGLTMFSAFLWEVAQLDVYLHDNGYTFDVFLKYNWLNNGLDIIAAVLGIALALLIFKVVKRLIWY